MDCEYAAAPVAFGPPCDDMLVPTLRYPGDAVDGWCDIRELYRDWPIADC